LDGHDRVAGILGRCPIGWIASVILILGLWLAGRKDPSAYAFTFIGELAWAWIGLDRESYDILFLSSFFCILAARNWWLWSASNKKGVGEPEARPGNS
jgi:nicotinamide riboside transporter PnuC